MGKLDLREVFGRLGDSTPEQSSVSFEDRIAALAVSERTQELRVGFTNDLMQNPNPDKMMWIAGNNISDKWENLARAELVMIGREMQGFFDGLGNMYGYKQFLIDDTGSLEAANERINTVLGIVDRVATPVRESGGVFDPTGDWEEIVSEARETVDISEAQSDVLLQFYSSFANMGNYFSTHQHEFVINPETGMFRTIYFGINPDKVVLFNE